MNGVVKKKMDKGFGFISQEGQEKDLFFHKSSLVGITFEELEEGDKVTFEETTGQDGRKNATNVQRM